MYSYAYYNGQLGTKDSIKIPLTDRSIYFGDAIYDAAIGTFDRILWEDEHIERFLSNAARIGICHKYTKSFLSSLLREIAIKSMIENYFIYFQMSRNSIDRTHSAIGSSTNLLITVTPYKIEENQPPLKLITEKDIRYELCDIKTTNLLPAVLASTKAEKEGFDEAVFIKNGIVTECAKSNISIIKQGRLITHPKNNHILPGITREHLLMVCKRFYIPVEEHPFSKEEMLSADEILVSGTSKLCRTVKLIDDTSVGGKSKELAYLLCRSLYAEYADFCLK